MDGASNGIECRRTVKRGHSKLSETRTQRKTKDAKDVKDEPLSATTAVLTLRALRDLRVLCLPLCPCSRRHSATKRRGDASPARVRRDRHVQSTWRYTTRGGLPRGDLRARGDRGHAVRIGAGQSDRVRAPEG